MSRCSISRGRSRCSRARGWSRAPIRAAPTTARRSRLSQSRASRHDHRDRRAHVSCRDYSLADAPAIDILVVPGGFGTRALLHDEPTLAWIGEPPAARCQVTSVCTGALLLAKAGCSGQACDDALGGARSARLARPDHSGAARLPRRSRRHLHLGRRLGAASTWRSRSSSRSADARWRARPLITSNIPGGRHDVPKHQNARLTSIRRRPTRKSARRRCSSSGS